MVLSGARPSAAAALLTPYLPRIAVTWTAETPDHRWRATDGSLVFVDISGFTALSERLARRGPAGAEELVDILDGHFSEMLAAAYADGGGLLKFGGDALLLLFDGPDHPTRAARSALRMRGILRGAGNLRTSVGAVRLRMSVGIHSGELHLFRIGRSHRELLLTGPAATTTVAMETAAGAGEIVVSPSTAAAIDPRSVGAAAGPGFLLRSRSMGDTGPDRGYPVAPVADGDIATDIPVVLRRHLLEGGGDAEHRNAAVAFIRFEGTDSLLATAGADAVADALEALIGDVQAAADANAVTFVSTDIAADGGKVVLAAGAPWSLDDDEGRMLRTVRAVADGGGGRALAVHIGVNRGRLFTGAIGPPFRRTYTVMGDAVNLAARLMAAAGPGRILVAPEVLERSRAGYEVTALPPFLVKGKVAPVQASELGRATGDHERRRAGRLPFVGRDPELTSLLAAMSDAVDGHGRLVEVTGDVGSGKSRLIDELHARRGDVPVHLVRCEPYEATTPFGAARRLLAAVAGLPPGAPDELDLLLDRVKADPSFAQWRPLLADVLGTEATETDATRELGPQFRRERTIRVIVAVLDTLLDGPVVLSFDDVHWIDPASGAVLGHIATAVHDRRWLVTATRRDDTGGFVADTTTGAASLPLLALDDTSVQALVKAGIGGRALPPRRRNDIVERAGGNPLFVEELLHHNDSMAPDAEELPVSLDAVVAAEIDRLSVQDRRLLRVASVLGSRVDIALLRRIAGDVGPVGAPLLARLERFLLPDGEGHVRFRHRVVRDVAYAALPFRRRRELHERAALAIESRGPVDAVGAAWLSLHCHHAHLYERCWRYARMAGQRALEKHACDEAVELFERAVAAAERVGVVPDAELAGAFGQLAHAATITGSHDRVRWALGRARQLRAAWPAEVASLYLSEARIAERESRLSSAVRWLGRGLRTLDAWPEQDTGAERAHLYATYGWLRQQQGRPGEALRWAGKAMEAAEASADLRAIAAACMVLDAAHLATGAIDLATNGERAAAIYETLGDLANRAALLNNLGALAFYRGEWSKAASLYDEAREANTRMGNIVDAGFGSCNRAEVLADQGHLDQAETELLELVALWRSVDFGLGVALATRHLGRVAARRGDTDEARRSLTEARQTFTAHGMHAREVEVDAWLAECDLRDGDATAAGRHAAAALATAEERGGGEFVPMLRRVRAMALASEGHLDLGLDEIDASIAVARERGAGLDIALGLLVKTELARSAGLPYDAALDREQRRIVEQLQIVALHLPALPAQLSPAPCRSLSTSGTSNTGRSVSVTPI